MIFDSNFVLQSLQEDVRRQMEREKELQSKYGKLQETLQELQINSA